jgi:hypothetical protein
VADEEIGARHTLPRIPHGQLGHQHTRAWSLADLRSFQRAMERNHPEAAARAHGDTDADIAAIRANARSEKELLEQLAAKMPGDFPSVNGSANR